MKILYTICSVCILAMHINCQLRQGNQQRKGLNPLNDDSTAIRYSTESSYDKYIQDLLNSIQTTRSTQSSNTINNIPVNEIPQANYNYANDRVNGIQDEASPIALNPIRFMGVGSTEVEQLNNITYAITTFGINLMKSINYLQTGNIIVSPTSIATVLALLQQGTFGDAQNQITRSLQTPPEVSAPTYKRLTYDMKKRNSRNILTVSNNLFVGDGFDMNPDFKETAVENFGSEVTTMDFSRPAWAVNQINKWVAIQTHNRIENLLPPNAVGINTQLVIANAVYFKGLWETKFKKEATKKLTFNLSNGETKSVPFMRMRHGFKFGIEEDTRARVVVMPFERHQYSLILILPHQLSSVDTILGSLTNAKLVSYHKFEEIETQLEIPKFTMKSDTNLIPVLKVMGITEIFSQKTDLTRIGTYRTFSPEITSAIHTGYLSVDEQGLSASAATGFAAVALSYDDPSATFRANRPFLAILWDTQFAIPLFIARIEDPSL
ncbi:leukocyte elastase inhibitor-like [Pararge aegeria]|uniref:Jg25449 protein n=4 Tax=Pararge aegeria TaxID=116150 RepID=A0A8S4SDR1_9NEOP|nr:leukocyte elastase inhibitor-like [Pararge aegeria]CAH2261874.1 jg25449 [Pararge aegeria aegeria]